MKPDRDATEAALKAGAPISRTGDWMSAEIGDELVMMSVASGRYIGLSETGRRIWELLATPLTLAALSATLAKEYEATADEVAADVIQFVFDLIACGAVSLTPAA